ncbi:T-complex protein 1 subunit zeta-like [Cimex lectularius]|uniref:T-complex protein 1 subunit zeta n=1 Tax=Cimex lectularius TaxID=79782 RepID=A0A8I6RGW5_CIMLE|nr:T-complex protein 1 subunit zeta-like [Cimex lectularius]
MASISYVNPKAEYVKAAQALNLNITAARGLQDVMKTNLGPKGTMKMLVSGSGEIRITKDGNVLLHDMQIQHPTVALIARTCTAMDDNTGDGTTSTVLMIAEFLKQADMYISEGVHPRTITEGFGLARNHCLKALENFKLPYNGERDLLYAVAKTSLNTKLPSHLADILTDACVDAVLAVKEIGNSIDLHMVEIMTMKSKLETETKLVDGIVLDHGARHPNMPKRLTNAYILTCNVSLEYEKTEVNSGFFYKSAEERDKLVLSEREFIQKRVNKIIELKKKVCDGTDKGFVVINQKGIDPISLDALAKEGILALRRAKKRNMERLTLACGGAPMNSVDDLTEDCLGHAGLVYEYVLGENKYTFVMECAKPQSVTILIHGPTQYAITQIKDAVRDGLRAIKNTIDDGCLLPGGGAIEVSLRRELLKYADSITDRNKVGIKAFADALLIIPKVLAVNGGHDPQEIIGLLDVESKDSLKFQFGLDIDTGKPMIPSQVGVYDNFSVKRQSIISSVVVASNLLLVDEVMRAGLSSLKG